MTVLRDQLLAGRALTLRGSVAPVVRERLAALGAEIDGERPETLVYDSAGAFGAGGRDGLRAAIDGAWEAILEVSRAWVGSDGDELARKIVLLAPPPDAGPLAAAAAAALENLARTLSVEWARYRVTVTMISPGDQLPELVCFLASRAGEYFSGCRFNLG